MKVHQVIKKLISEGWTLVRQRGSHKQFKHPEKEDLITLPDHGRNKELSKGVLNDIKKKAGWK